MTQLLHITDRDSWLAARASGSYELSTRGRTLAEEGYIHTSLPHQLRTVAEHVYPDMDDLVVLVVDSERLAAKVVYEPPAPGMTEEFPHVYGPIPVDAVTDVISVTRDEHGRFILPE